MRLTNIFTTIFIILAVSSVCFAQDFGDDENWLSEIGGDYMGYERITYWLVSFTKEDAADARQKLKTIRAFAPKDEWEGIYYENTGVGDRKMIWNAAGGFLEFYYYHDLKYLDYGKVADSAGVVELNSEKTFSMNPRLKKKTKAESKFVKVKLGEKHYLVSENHLRNFCILAVGRNTEISFNEYYWSKEEDVKKKVFGLPILPKKYAYLIRQPIQAKIIRAVNRKIVQQKLDDGTVNYEEIYYNVTLNAGKNKNVKSGMSFFVEDLGEWVQIEKVLPNSSIGFIKRSFDENKKEECRDSEGGSGDIIPCKKISVGLEVKTKASENYF